MSDKSNLSKHRIFQGNPMVRMHVMTKATGPLCNLDCSYCYYLSKEKLLSNENKWRISDDLLEDYIRQYIEQQNAPQIIFSWQGGEPTLLGLEFFRTVVDLQRKYTPKGVRCENDLQTNGTLLDDDWCAFLHENNFLIGLSIDGPEQLHDTYRTYKGGKGSFRRVIETAHLLHKHKVNFATLTVVNNVNSAYPLEVYRFLRDEIGSKQMQFIPIVEPKTFTQTAPQYWKLENMPVEGSPLVDPRHSESFVAPWCVESESYGDFLIAIFDEWLQNDFGKIVIPFFDSAIEQWIGHPSQLCIFAPMCGKGLAMEHNGDVFACDHYVYPEYKIGNIKEKKLIEMALSHDQEHFGRAKDFTLPVKCRKCRYLFACSGECPKNRLLKTQMGEPGLNYLCKGLYKYFTHIDPYVRQIVHHLGYTVADDVPIS